ncbi:hypothetical protein Afil01_41650 [Actinorhabdospora filicis]|uniref:tRNA nuclease CdiA C-terminal domain-containing protein n=1 Tax=Actinorhabdospora filicis TaxID=1785913 RepID=A0A9W6WAT5_9ACTN|nr:hypothetical protein [Actinorhabdospora filicis]GLZ79358.1 hypothetical protein Afil01_41650 [Actinorhabdospora filicis]
MTAADLGGDIAALLNGMGLGKPDGANLGVLGDRADPGAALRAKYPWVMVKFEKLTRPLEQLEGVPAVIQAYADRWRAVGGQAGEIGGSVTRSLQDLSGLWGSKGASAYETYMTRNAEGLYGLTTGAAAMADIAVATGEVAADIREQIFELAAKAARELIHKIPQWIAERGGMSPTVKVALLAAAAALIAGFLVTVASRIKLLREQLDKFIKLLGNLRRLVDAARDVLRLPEADKTGPTLPPDPDRKPKGTPEPEFGDPNKAWENKALKQLAEDGYDVTQRPPPRANGRKPDADVDGEYWDATVAGTNHNTLRREILDKVGTGPHDIQADRILVVVPPGTSDDALRKAVFHPPIRGLREIKVWRGTGPVEDFYP